MSFTSSHSGNFRILSHSLLKHAQPGVAISGLSIAPLSGYMNVTKDCLPDKPRSTIQNQRLLLGVSLPTNERLTPYIISMDGW
jgi:hypothetical protein